MHSVEITIAADGTMSASARLLVGDVAALTLKGVPQGVDASGLRFALVSPTRQILAATENFSAQGVANLPLTTKELAAYLAGMATGRLRNIAATVYSASTMEPLAAAFLEVVALPIQTEYTPLPSGATYVTTDALTAALEDVYAAIPAPSDADPEMDGTAAAGSSAAYARADHVHPTDSSRASASDVEALQWAAWFPDGSVTSIADCTSGLNYDYDETNHTATVLAFSTYGTPGDGNNADKSGPIVIPPYVETNGVRYAVTAIGGEEGNLCADITSLKAPTTVTQIGGNAFYNCTSLASVSLPSCTTVGEWAFFGCTSLASVSLPSCTTVGNYAFTYCGSLASVSLPACTTVGEWAFFDCTSLASVDFGTKARSSVPTLGDGAFGNVPNTCKIIVPDAQFTAWKAASGWSSLVTAGYRFLRHSEWEAARRYEVADTYAPLASPALTGNPTAPTATAGTSTTQVATTAFVAGAVSGKLDAAQRNLLPYAAASSGVTLSATTAVYRAALAADGTFPTIDATDIGNGSAYYCFELELVVPATVPSTITGPSGWAWVDGQELPDPSDLTGGETIYIAARLDCASGVRTFLASVWRVA